MDDCKWILDNISAYLDGELNIEDKDKFLKHIQNCPECKKELEETENLLGLISNIEEEELPDGFHDEFMKKLLLETKRNIQVKEEKTLFDKVVEFKPKNYQIRKIMPLIASFAALMFIVISLDGVINKPFTSGNSKVDIDVNSDSYGVMSSESTEDEATENYVPEVSDIPMAASSEQMDSSLESADSEELPAEGRAYKSDNNNYEIQNYDISIKVDDIEETIENINNSYGITISSDVNFSSGNYGSITRSVNNVDVEDFINDLSFNGKIIEKNRGSQNAKTNILRLEAQIEAESEERENLKLLISRVDKIEDLVTINERLSNINYSINEKKSSLNRYNDESSNTIITINISENPKPIETIEDESFLDEIKNAFLSSIENSLIFVKYLVLLLSFLVVPAVIVIVIFLFIFILKRKGGKNEKK